jgi:hypothetical protein
VQQRLALAPTAQQIARFAVPPNLAHVPAHRLPALYLTAIFAAFGR